MALLILGVILTIVALLLAGFALRVYLKSTRLARSGIQAPGVVVELASHPSRGRGQHTWAPVVEFRSRDGRMHRFESALRSYPARHTVGQSLTVAYAEGAESEAVILDFQNLYLGSILLSILAFSALIFALACYWGMSQPS